MTQQNRTAIITGATGGLGMAFAKKLAQQQYNLVISGRQEDKLTEMSRQLSERYSVAVEPIIADLSCAEGIRVLTDKIDELGSVDTLVSNAGYGEHSLFNDERVDDVMKMISVHINATVQLVHKVLPDMIRKKCGNIISVSSLSAFVPAPGSSIYSSSKLFLNSFMEAIHMEVHKLGIRVQSLCPGLVHTGFHQGSMTEHTVEMRGVSLWMEPDEVVYASMRGLQRGEVICVPGHVNKLIKSLVPVLPRRPYYSVVKRIARKFRQ